MHRSPVPCEQCVEAGRDTPADYVFQPEETSLAGPTMGDPDYWPPDVNGRRCLCRQHYEGLPADSRLDYVPAEDNKNEEDQFGLSGEMGRKSL